MCTFNGYSNKGMIFLTSFKIPFVSLSIYDLRGREINRLVYSKQDPGFKSVLWDATDFYGKPVSAGLYMYQIRSGDFIQTKKMVLLK